MLTENFGIFFNPEIFGTAATVGGASVNGILDREYVEVETGNFQISGYKPTFTCATEDVASVAVGDAVVADGTSYTVAAPPQLDNGVTKLVLKEV